MPRRGIYDNMKTAVDRVQQGKKRVINTRFYAMTAYYLFDPEFCNVASGWEKGQVEKNVQDCRRRIWDQARQLNFSTLEELNRWLEQCCRAVWSDLMHPEGQGLTVAEAFDLEQAHLMPMPTPFDGYVDWETRASSTCLVAVDRNRYSVPCKWANKIVSVHQYADHIDVYAGHERVAQHIRSFERGKAVYEWQHYLPVLERKPGVLRDGAPFAMLPIPLQRLKAALLRQCDGDKVMVQVLACVPIHGLETVLVAVELVLESGVASLEHIDSGTAARKPRQGSSLGKRVRKAENRRAINKQRMNEDLSLCNQPHGLIHSRLLSEGCLTPGQNSMQFAAQFSPRTNKLDVPGNTSPVRACSKDVPPPVA